MPDQPEKRQLTPRLNPVADRAAHVSDSELLSILFRRGDWTRPALALAVRLLGHFGGLRKTLNASPEELQAVRGVGEARLATLLAVRELACRYFEETLPAGEAIRSPSDTEAFLMARLRDKPHEIFCCIFLDNRHRVLRFDELFRGTIDGTSVYPREIVKQALGVNAAAVILAHNR